MCCGANFAWTNRQLITHWTRQSFEKVLGQSADALGMEIVYDVCHNIGKIEEHDVDGKRVKVLVHRKGATRAFPAGHPETPAKYRDVGQPVLIPGDMGSCSFVLVGLPASMQHSFGSSCHGAGRQMSRKAAERKFRAKEVRQALAQKGIYLHAASQSGIVEEAPGAYKNVEDVVRVAEGAGLTKIVARMVPLGVVKGGRSQSSRCGMCRSLPWRTCPIGWRRTASRAESEKPWSCPSARGPCDLNVLPRRTCRRTGPPP